MYLIIDRSTLSDIVILGKQAIDDDANQTTQLLAGELIAVTPPPRFCPIRTPRYQRNTVAFSLVLRALGKGFDWTDFRRDVPVNESWVLLYPQVIL